jgi:putative membrane protein
MMPPACGLLVQSKTPGYLLVAVPRNRCIDGSMTDNDRPDERFTLASERTFLAWMRSSLALLAGGLAMIHLVPEFSTGWVRTTLGLILIGLAAAAALVGLRRWSQVEKALREGAPMPPPHELRLFAVALTVVALGAGLASLVAVL